MTFQQERVVLNARVFRASGAVAGYGVITAYLYGSESSRCLVNPGRLSLVYLGSLYFDLLYYDV